jgi:hypothetical protein
VRAWTRGSSARVHGPAQPDQLSPSSQRSAALDEPLPPSAAASDAPLVSFRCVSARRRAGGRRLGLQLTQIPGPRCRHNDDGMRRGRRRLPVCPPACLPARPATAGNDAVASRRRRRRRRRRAGGCFATGVGELSWAILHDVVPCLLHYVQRAALRDLRAVGTLRRRTTGEGVAMRTADLGFSGTRLLRARTSRACASCVA